MVMPSGGLAFSLPLLLPLVASSSTTVSETCELWLCDRETYPGIEPPDPARGGWTPPRDGADGVTEWLA